MFLSLSTLWLRLKLVSCFWLLVKGMLRTFFSLRLFYVHLYVLRLCEYMPCKRRLPERSEEGRLPLRPEEDIRSLVAWTQESCEPRDMRAGSEPRSSGRTSALNFSATALTQYGHLKITGDTEIIYFYVLYFYGLLQSHNSHFKRTGWSMTVSSQCHLK